MLGDVGMHNGQQIGSSGDLIGVRGLGIYATVNVGTNQASQDYLARIDPTPNATLRSGATDWADLAERMHFITDLFRCWHARAELFTPPYDAVQIAAIRDGRRPGGVL